MKGSECHHLNQMHYITQVRQPGISFPNVLQTASPREHQSKEVNQNLIKAFRKVTDINNQK